MNEVDDTMTIYTSSITTIRKLDEIYQRIKEDRDKDGKLFAVWYRADKGLIAFKAKKHKRHLTEEQREAKRKTLAMNRKKRSSSHS